MLRNSQSRTSRAAPGGATFAWGTAIGMLHTLLDAVREGLAAHREYERLISMGMRHDLALRSALSETSHSREASTRERRFNLLFSLWWPLSVHGLTAGYSRQRRGFCDC
jgi:hypothetical protein